MKEIKTTNFILNILQQENSVLITQQMLNNITSTSKLPATVDVLNKSIPTIFLNECFNGRNLPFAVEVTDTESGHLFEHLVLENLKLESLKYSNYAEYFGETSWNWNLNQFGKFTIQINSPNTNSKIFYRALLKSIHIFEEICKKAE